MLLNIGLTGTIYLHRPRACFCSPSRGWTKKPTNQQVAVSQPHVERLFAAQANLELRISRSLSLGRWLWRGVNFSGAAAAAGAATAATSGGGGGLGPGAGGSGGVDGVGGETLKLDLASTGVGRGVMVPWETEAANASPECLKVSKSVTVGQRMQR